MTALVATDLDRTLVYSRRSAGAPSEARRTVEEHDGVPSAWVTAQAAHLLSALGEAAAWVPATTRTVAQFRRLRLPGAHRWSVCAHGGVVLDDGVADAAWSSLVLRRLARVASVDEIGAAVARLLDLLPDGVVGPLRRAEGLFLVARIDPTRVPRGWAEELAAVTGRRGWTALVGEAKVHVLPDGLSKVAAIEEVRRRCGSDALLAAGDSRLDAELLLAADAGIRPAHGELHALGWQADHVAVTTSSGLRAGEEIAGWLLDRATR
jgi:hypothetical protein